MIMMEIMVGVMATITAIMKLVYGENKTIFGIVVILKE